MYVVLLNSLKREIHITEYMVKFFLLFFLLFCYLLSFYTIKYEGIFSFCQIRGVFFKFEHR